MTCSELTGAAPFVVFWLCGPSAASRLDILCIHRCSSAHLGCNGWLFELPLPSYQLGAVWPSSSDLWHQRGIFTQENCCSLCIFCLSVYSLRWLWEGGGVPVDEQFQTSSSGTMTHATSLKSPLFPPFWCSVWNLAGHVHMPKCTQYSGHWVWIIQNLFRESTTTVGAVLFLSSLLLQQAHTFYTDE